MKTILVTGAAGLIGSHLCDALLAKGHKVIGMDNMCIGKMRNIEHNLGNDNFVFEEGDVLDRKALGALGKDADVIAHMAAFKIPIKEMKAENTLILNTEGTKNVLDLAKETKARVVFASTSDVYGKGRDIPFREGGDLVIGPSDVPRWSYAVSKLFDEHLCFSYMQAHDVPIVVLRYFNSYGPRHDLSYVSGGPQALFIDAMLHNRPITIYGTGNQTRSFAYITESADCTVRAIESGKAAGEIFNVGNGSTEISVKDLAFLVEELTVGKGNAKIGFMAHEKAFGKYEEVDRRVPDLSKAKKILGYNPVIGNREGLERTIEWHRGLEKR